MTDGMTREHVEAIGLLIGAHWPHPALTDFDLDVMAQALRAVPPADVARAIDRLVTTGERYQPRAPRIMAALAELGEEDRRVARDLAWAERDAQRTLESAAASPCPPDVREQLARLRRGVR